jgi:mycoredoxin
MIETGHDVGAHPINRRLRPVSVSVESLPQAGTVTMYSTVWCGYCRRLKAQMDREGIAYQVIDIEDHPDAADLVRSVNGGHQTVPTLVFEDGSALTNPSLAEIKAKLAA